MREQTKSSKVGQRITLGAVMVLSLVIVIILRWQFEGRIVEAFAAAFDAVFIAAFLAFTVDPFLKRELFREASSDIFLFWLGYSLPHRINEFLHSFVTETKLLRSDCVLRWTIVQEPSTDHVRLELAISYDFENVTRKWQTYTQQARVYDSSPEEENTVLSMKCIAPMYPSLEYEFGPKDFQRKPDGYIAGPELRMPPQRQLEARAGATPRIPAGNNRIRFETRYSSRSHRTGSDSWRAGAPTIKVTVICGPTDQFDFRLDWQNAQTDEPGKWVVDDILLTGHGFNVYWSPREQRNHAEHQNQ